MTRRLIVPVLVLVCSACSDSTAPPVGPLDIPVSSLPRQVPLVAVDHGPQPGEIEVSWWIVSWSTHPIEEYQVALSHEGPITEANWPEAEILGRFPWRKGQVAYRELFGAGHGLVQGSVVWIAVRARDTQDNLSRLEESLRLTVTSEWWIEGRILDLFGNPAPGTEVGSLQAAATAPADAEGTYRMGPFRNIDIITLDVDGSTGAGAWYGMTGRTIRSRPGVPVVGGQDFHLIPRHDLDPYCQPADSEFLTYLRQMTYTTPRSRNPAASILHRWDHYPLSVYIPAYVNGEGVAMDEGADAALALWNGIMGEDYFARTEAAEGADIFFDFREMEGFYGLVTLVLPDGPDAELGRVVPRRMRVDISTLLHDHESVAEISLHELGHTLGLYAHAGCTAPGYLMVPGGGFGALDRAEPIHIDERRAVECIRHLPQGQDMSQYRME